MDLRASSHHATVCHHPEVERTYAVSPATVDAVLTGLDRASRDGLAVGGDAVECAGPRARVRTYLYLRTSAPELTDRFVFSYERSRVVGHLSSKRWVTSGGTSVKYHWARVEMRGLSECAVALRDGPPVVAALLKAQRRYVFRGAAGPHAGTAFRVAVDAMVPFRPDAPSVCGEPFFDLEVEARGGHDPAWGVRALRQVDRAFRRMRAIGCGKRERAARAAGGAVRLAFPTGEALRRYLGEVRAVGGLQLRPWLPRLLAGGRAGWPDSR